MKRQNEENEFVQIFLNEFVSTFNQVQTKNTDFVRFPGFSTSLWDNFREWTVNKFFCLAKKMNLVYISQPSLKTAIEGLSLIMRQAKEFDSFYGQLCDETSRQLMIKLITFHIFGNRWVRLPLNNRYYWESLDFVRKSLLKQAHTIPIESLNGYLDYYELQECGFPICLHAHTLNVLNTFVLQQYRYKKNGKVVQVDTGNIVIDAGACWGDTTLYFAHLVGEDGKVFSFEFVPGNLYILKRNLDLNKSLNDRVKVVSEAVSDRSGEIICYRENGPSTSLTRDYEGTTCVQTTAIDDFVKEEGVEKVDFIKMDIEGSELKALQGAEHTIKRFRPKLAIALYHKEDDFIAIPNYLKSLGLEYDFFLDHFTIHREETVFFACPRS